MTRAELLHRWTQLRHEAIRLHFIGRWPNTARFFFAEAEDIDLFLREVGQ